MNPPILPNGTLVQLISTAEFDSHCRAPGDSAYLGKAPDGSDDIMDVSRRPLCGCIAEIVGYWHKSFPYYMLKLVDASTAANPEFASDKDRFGLSGFSRNEFHVLYDLPFPSTSTPKYVFFPGDHVTVRTWDSMMEEYGPDPYGGIAVHPNKLSFVLGMKPFCGKEFTVVKIVHNKDLPDEPVYFLNYLPDAHVDPSDDDSLYGWLFTSAMLLPAARPNEFATPAIPIPSVSFDQLLQGAK